MTLHDLEPLRPWAVLIGCVGFCIAGAIYVECSPLTNSGYRKSNPPKPGVYRTKVTPDDDEDQFNRWDGESWYWTGYSIEDAIKQTTKSKLSFYWKEV